MTLGQIVQRQREAYALLERCTGEVGWQDERLGPAGEIVSRDARGIYFARDGETAITLIQPWDERPPFPPRGREIMWERVISAALVTSDTVFTVRADEGSSVPVVTGLPFNPAVHERNPLVAFHPRVLGDERVGLGDFLEMSGRLAQQPRVYEMVVNNAPVLRIDFTNPEEKDSLVYYYLNPAKGYLAEEIGVMRAGRMRVRMQIIVGQTPDKYWIPARTLRTEFGEDGRPTRRETWYYWSFANSENLPRRAFTLDALGLSKGAKYEGILPPPDLLPAGVTLSRRPE